MDQHTSLLLAQLDSIQGTGAFYRNLDWTALMAQLLEQVKVDMGIETQTVFEYRQAQGARSNMETAIQFAGADLDMETIRKGSPHTLKLTKNRASYDQAMHEFNAAFQAAFSIYALKRTIQCCFNRLYICSRGYHFQAAPKS
jgi:hypothetical protein